MNAYFGSRTISSPSLLAPIPASLEAGCRVIPFRGVWTGKLSLPYNYTGIVIVSMIVEITLGVAK